MNDSCIKIYMKPKKCSWKTLGRINDIDALAETIEGANLLKEYVPSILSCSRCSKESCWYVVGCGGYTEGNRLDYSKLVVPTILYK